MAHVIQDLIAGRRRCTGLEERLERIPRDRERAKRLLAEAIAECIVEILGRDLVEEVYLVDLSGGEVALDFSGRDIDLIVIVSKSLMGYESDLKRLLEDYFNRELVRLMGWYIAETGKKELVELHVVTSLDMGYGRLVRSRFYPAIRLWSKAARRDLGGQVFPYPF